MAGTVYVCLTSDVERIHEMSPTGGPKTWEEAEAAARSFCDFLGPRGYPVTNFIVPDTAKMQPAIFRQMQKEGHECGFHFHPQSWRDHYLREKEYTYLGGYSGAEQRQMLHEGIE